MNPHESWKPRLAAIIAEFGCQTGTLHRTLADGRTLDLICQIGVPDVLLEKITRIPFGKGIAGAAAERREPVELCNLQQDLGGVAKPGARKTGVSGSLAMPVFASAGEHVIGTVGIGMAATHEFTDAEKHRLGEIAREIALLLENNRPGDD